MKGCRFGRHNAHDVAFRVGYLITGVLLARERQVGGWVVPTGATSASLAFE